VGSKGSANAPTVIITGMGNYTGSTSAEFTIKYYDGAVTVLYNGAAEKTEWYNRNVEISAQSQQRTSGYQVSDDINGTWADTFTISTEGNITKQLYFKQNGTGYITDGKTISVNIDKTVPTFDGQEDGISIDTHRWYTLLNRLTFGIFFKETKEVTIHATDAGVEGAVPSQVAAYYYYVDTTGNDTVYTSEELTAKVFAEAEDGKFYIDDESKYVIYAYAVDKAGNQSDYICSNGMVLDKTAPALPTYVVSDVTEKSAVITLTSTDTGSGIETYELENLNTEADSDQAVITQLEPGKFSLTGLKPNTTYILKYAVTDKAGNRTVNSGDGVTNGITVTTLKAAITETMVTVGGSFVYDGYQKIPTVTVKYGETVLTEGTDYKVIYESNINAGTDTAKVIVTALENSDYTGVVTKTFSIAKADLNPEELPEFTVGYGYKGKDVVASADSVTHQRENASAITIPGTWKLEDEEKQFFSTEYVYVTFTPSGEYYDNYNQLKNQMVKVNVEPVTPKITLTVNKAKQVAGKIVTFNVLIKHPAPDAPVTGFSRDGVLQMKTGENNGEAVWTNLPGLAYTIPQDAVIGTVYEFRRILPEVPGKYTAAQSAIVEVTVSDKEIVDDMLSLNVTDIVYGKQPDPKPGFTGTADGTATWTYLYGKVTDTAAGTVEEYKELAELFGSGNVIACGEYSVKAIYEDDSQTGEVVAAFTVKPKELTAIFRDQDVTKVYDMTTEVSGLSEDPLYLDGIVSSDDVHIDYSSITYAYDTKNVGTGKTITIKGIALKGDASDNYTVKPSLQIHCAEITSKELTVTVEVPDKIYDGKKEVTGNITFVCSGVITGDSVSATMKEAWYGDEKAGMDKIAMVYFTLSNPNYTALKDPTAEGSLAEAFCVEGKGNILAKELAVDVTVADKQYDGLNNAEISQAELVGLVEGDTVTLTNGTATFTSIDAGEEIAVSFTEFAISGEDAGNYTLTQPAGIKANIVNNWVPTEGTEYVVNDNGWINQNFEVTAGDGYLLSLSNTAGGEWQNTFTKQEETANGILSFYVKNVETGAISLQVTETYRIDKTPAVGIVSIDEHKWNTFLNYITFGLLFNETQTVKVEAQDTLSGIAKIEYYESQIGVNQAYIADLGEDAWTQMSDDSVDVTAVDAKRFVYYIRITDLAGNITYLSTDGVEYDLKVPVVTGITDGMTGYVTLSVSVTDENAFTVTLKTVTAEGETSEQKEDSFLLAGDVEAVYTIIATDAAGNETMVTVNMKKITDLQDAVTDLETETITSAEKETLEIVEKAVNDQNLDNATEEEKEALQDVLQKSQDLLAQINAAEEAVNTDAVNDTAEITEDTVSIADIEDLKAAKEDLEKAKESYGSNYTEEEAGKLEQEMERIEAAIQVAEAAKPVAEAIEALPQASQVTAGDTAVAAALQTAKEAYDALTDKEKAVLGAEYVAKMTAIENALKEEAPQPGDGNEGDAQPGGGDGQPGNNAATNSTVQNDSNAAPNTSDTMNGGQLLLVLLLCMICLAGLYTSRKKMIS